MDAKTIDHISRQVARQFPEVTATPSVKPQASAKGNGNANTYLLTYSNRVDTHSGPSFNRRVRVVADGDGHILKITTSR